MIGMIEIRAERREPPGLVGTGVGRLAACAARL